MGQVAQKLSKKAYVEPHQYQFVPDWNAETVGNFFGAASYLALVEQWEMRWWATDRTMGFPHCSLLLGCSAAQHCADAPEHWLSTFWVIPATEYLRSRLSRSDTNATLLPLPHFSTPQKIPLNQIQKIQQAAAPAPIPGRTVNSAGMLGTGGMLVPISANHVSSGGLIDLSPVPGPSPSKSPSHDPLSLANVFVPLEMVQSSKLAVLFFQCLTSHTRPHA